MYERGKRTSDLLAALDSQIAVDPKTFDVFLSVLAKRPSMSDLCGRMKNANGKSVGQAHLVIVTLLGLQGCLLKYNSGNILPPLVVQGAQEP